MAGHYSRRRWWLDLAVSRKWPLLVVLLVGSAAPLIVLLLDRAPPTGWRELFEGLAMVGLAGLLLHVATAIALCALIRWWTNQAIEPPALGNNFNDDSDWGKGPPWSPSLVPTPRKPPSLAAHATPPIE